jgi:HNH endonuclease
MVLNMPKCIYCLEDRAKSDFTKDHVIPESFGTFKNNFTLVNKVCGKCNQYFGDELELFLGRDTFEGMLRYVYGVKAPQDFKFLHENRILFRLSEEGTWKGAIMRLTYNEEKNKIAVEPVTQVGFQKANTKKWEFFELRDLKSKNDLERVGFVVRGEKALKVLFGPEYEEKEKIVEQLKLKGINLEQEEPLPFNYGDGKTVNTEIQGTVDKIIFRGIAKIAFNYLAHFEEKDFVLKDDFNDIRRFIRYGETTTFKHVIIQKKPILLYEQRFGITETGGHMVTLTWNFPKTALVSDVTLFNKIIYKVIFCKTFSGIYRPIKRGHHFDVKSKEIAEMLTFPKNFYIP